MKRPSPMSRLTSSSTPGYHHRNGGEKGGLGSPIVAGTVRDTPALKVRSQWRYQQPDCHDCQSYCQKTYDDFRRHSSGDACSSLSASNGTCGKDNGLPGNARQRSGGPSQHACGKRTCAYDKLRSGSGDVHGETEHLRQGGDVNDSAADAKKAGDDAHTKRQGHPHRQVE